VCCIVLQCVAVCCSVLQCVAVCCSALQCVASCCSMLQCVAVCCRTPSEDVLENHVNEQEQGVLQYVAVRCIVLQIAFKRLSGYVTSINSLAVRCSVLQCVAVCCSLLQCVAVCCSVF